MEHQNEKLDCLFVHVPKITESNASILIMPMGILALANELCEHGINSKILHSLFAKVEDPKFSLVEKLKNTDAKIMCLPLHWHQASYNVMETIKEVKKSLPHIYTIIGGFTASFFHKEIMENFPDVDFIIRGDAEVPLLELSKKLLGKKNIDFKDIPNLTWREGKNIIINEHTYVVTQEIYDNLYYANFDLVYNQAFCLFGVWQGDPRLTKEEAYKAIAQDEILSKRIFYYTVGRGCTRDCVFCCGAIEGQKIINKRSEVIYRSHKSVLRDLKGVLQYNINFWWTCFDPAHDAEDYYIELFEKIRKENIKINLVFESWRLPTKKFFDAFKETFLPESHIIISIDTGSDKIRKIDKGDYYYSTQDLLDTFEYAYSIGVKMKTYFTVGMPFETQQDLTLTRELMKYLIDKYMCEIVVYPIELEPASPMWLHPEQFGLTLTRKNFMDFYHQHNNNVSMGYYTDSFTEEQIKELVEDLKKQVQTDLNERRKKSLIS